MQNSQASLRSENLLLRGKITELEAEIEEREEQRRDVAKQLAELGKSNQEMIVKVEDYRRDNELQVSKLQSQLEERSTAMAVSRSQLEALEESNQALGQLLQAANGRIVELTRHLAQRNRFIKEYFEQEEISDM